MPWFLIDSISGAEVAPARAFAITLAALLIVLAWLGIQAIRLKRCIARVPVRIHVAGTRGKSTTVRLVAAALRAHDLRVYGKTTGSEPRMILPDGSERRMRRLGPASIRELGGFMRTAALGGADAVVVECMAIRPEMLWASEALFVNATLLVITNARPDHFEDVGEAADAMAEALRWLIPPGREIVIAAEALTDAFAQHALAQEARLTVVDVAGIAPLQANRELALAVSRMRGVDQALAAQAMDAALPDPGHFTEETLTVGGKTVRFLNAFACNDIDSLAALWATRRSPERPVVLLNARADRPLRTKRFVAFLAVQEPKPFLFIMGDSLAVVLARQAGFREGSVRRLRSQGAQAVAEIAAAAAPGGAVWGIGNYHGFGRKLAAALAGPGEPC